MIRRNINRGRVIGHVSMIATNRMSTNTISNISQTRPRQQNKNAHAKRSGKKARKGSFVSVDSNAFILEAAEELLTLGAADMLLAA